MLVPKTPEEPCGLQLSFFLHSANVLDSNTAVILVLPLLPALAKENEKKCQTPCCICTFRSKLVFDLWYFGTTLANGIVGLETSESSALSEAKLVFSKIRPMSELRGLVLGCFRVAVGRTDALKFHEDVQEDVKVLLRLNGKLAFSLFRHVKQSACDGADFHGLKSR